MRIFFTIIGWCFIISLYPSELYAQLKYKPGYVVTQKSDTIYGSIGVNSFNQDYNNCYFKAKKPNKIFNYKPQDILAFCVPQTLFFISTDKLNIADKERVFAQVLIEGEITLIRFKEAYYIEQNGEIIKLGDDYKKVLGEMMSDCKSLKYDIMLAKRESTSLSKIVYFYNDFKKSDYTVYEYTPPGLIISPTLSLGMSYSQLISEINTKDKNKKNLTQVSQNQQIRGGLNVNFILPKLSKRFGLSVGAFYASSAYNIDFSVDIESKYTSLPSYTYYNQTAISFSSVDIPILINYNVPVGNWNLYVKSGFTNRIIFNSEYSSIIERQLENVIETNPFENEAELKSMQQGLIIGGGIQKLIMKRFIAGVDFEAESGNIIYRSENDFYDINSRTKSINASIFFKF